MVWWYISSVAACFPAQPGVGRQGCNAPPLMAALFEAYITNLGKYNEGELVGEWVKFPTTSEELQKVFERIGIGSKDDFGNPYEEWFISDYDCYVDGLYEKLGEYENLDELNYLAFFKKKPVIFFYEK